MSALEAYLRDNEIKKNEFARRIGVTPGRISQLLKNGERPGLALAAVIERETGGVIKIKDWLAEVAQ